MDKFLKFFPLVKVDIEQRIVYGLVTAEAEDKDGEVCDYASTKPEYQKVNAELGKASGGENIMPLREMHQLNAIGAGKSIDFDDDKKQIRMAFKVVDDSAWKKVLEKVLLGFSQGGRYIKKWKEGGKQFYTAQPGEVSLVDNPCLPGAFIEYAKADGTVETFKTPEITLSDLNTRLEKISAQMAELVGQQSAANGDAMKPEQIAKCAAALGITVEEFTKQFIETNLIAKGAKGMAAVHGHLETMAEHHAEMGKCHKAMGGHHEKMGTHIEKCMKACSDVMGSEGEKGEKAFQTLLDELHKAAEAAKAAPVVAADDKEKAAELAKAISTAVDAATKPLKEELEKLGKGLAPNNGGTGGARLTLVDRDGKPLTKAAVAAAQDPLSID